MRSPRTGLLATVAVIALVVTACTSTSSSPGESQAEGSPAEGSQAAESQGAGDARTVNAPEAEITVDGDASDWEDIDGLTLTLEAIADEEVDSHDASVKAAHDGDYIYVLFEVTDDYNWVADDAHLSAAAAVQWAVDTEAGAHMGAEESDRETSLGIVDLWHWELECAAGEETGGEVSEPGADADAGDDGGCNFDDEWSEVPETREDDNGSGAENSLLGVWSHSDPTADAAGTWIFEMRRPLDTGDERDAQFAVGETALMALAYWDPDGSPEGWADDGHVQSSNQGWIEVAVE